MIFFKPNINFFRQLQTICPKDISIVEIGAGDGALTRELNDKGWAKICPIDIFPKNSFVYYSDSTFYVSTPSIINGEGEVLCLGGYGPKKPTYFGGLNIHVQRTLKKVEKDLSGWLIGKAGEQTSRFNTKEWAIKQARRYAKFIFGDYKDWKEYLEDWA